MRQAQEPFIRIGVEEAKKLIDAGGVRVIDVREPDEWIAGHIPVATHIPLGGIVNKPTETLTVDKEDTLLFVCAVGGRSAIACEVAATMGYTHLYNLEGGTTAWRSSGNPVDMGQ